MGLQRRVSRDVARCAGSDLECRGTTRRGRTTGPRELLAVCDRRNFLETSLSSIRTALTDGHSGLDRPAAIILETLQAEGGINPAPAAWLKGLQALCREHDILMIVDDIQVGCYRTGEFFSFEAAGIEPDMIVLSKSIGGLGFPMSLLLLRPVLDISSPGEHTGTFRGNQLAFVAGAAALEYATHERLSDAVKAKAQALETFLRERIEPLHGGIPVRGRGLIWGIELADHGGADVAKAVGRRCFENGLIIERAGRGDTVMKVMPALTIDDAVLMEGLGILERAVQELGKPRERRRVATAP